MGRAGAGLRGIDSGAAAMKILMMTNTYTPHVGGVARSVESFTRAYRERGHEVLVVAPEYEGTPPEKSGVIRVPAVQQFMGSDFVVALPVLRDVDTTVEGFQPNIVHSHHPFLLGATAVRVANIHGLPLVFTHHTMYEDYTHYVAADSQALKRFVISLSTHYANLCDLVFAPSGSVRRILQERGVETPITVMPTGVDIERFRRGSGRGFRAAVGIPPETFLVGHVGRLAHEKNLSFLVAAVVAFLEREPRAQFLVVGKGPDEREIREAFAAAGQQNRLHMLGTLQRELLVSSYKAMDVFVFASKSETQGMVLVEAMAGGAPVVALDANGSRDVIVDEQNGRLVKTETVEELAAALYWIATRSAEQRRKLRSHAKKTANRLTLPRMADRALSRYAKLLTKARVSGSEEDDLWTRMWRGIEAEWNVIKGVAGATGTALTFSEPEGESEPE
jgi:glycosyltransferase involved in cell wall biosynthesis